MLVLSIVLVCGALYALAFFWLALEAKNAPEGWEDEGGWHEGERRDAYICDDCGSRYFNRWAHLEECPGKVRREA